MLRHRAHDERAARVVIADRFGELSQAAEQPPEGGGLGTGTRGVRVYTVGVGNAQGTVLRLEGRQVRTFLDEATLKRIAELTDADYFNTSDADGLREVYEKLQTQVVFRQED